MQYLIRVFPLLLLLQQIPIHAQWDDIAAQEFFADTPLILTASRMTKPLLESPASVSVIERELIDASGVREIAELFRLVPGFVVGFHSGHAPAVTYHGLGQEFGRQIQVLIDGRSVFIPSFGGVPWSNLPLFIEDIERIEVIRGPNAVTYGANAFLATINIITREAVEDTGVKFSLTSSDNANPDIEDAYLRIGNRHENIDWRLSLGASNDEGFADINDSKRIAKASFRADLQAASNQFWSIQLGNSNRIAGRGFPASVDDAADIERSEEADNGFVNLQWEGVWDSSTSIARLTHTRQQVIDNYDPGPFDFKGFTGVTTFIDFDRDSVRTDLEFIQTTDISDNTRLVYGGSVRQDRVRSLFLLNSDRYHEVVTYRSFGSVEWRINEDWLLDLGVMLEDSDITSIETSPRISLIRSFGKNHALRLVASAAKRNPILWEHDGETEFVANFPPFGTVVVPRRLGNNSIEPENIESFEIGLRSKFSSKLGSDIKLFSYRITDQIDNDINTLVDAGPLLGNIEVVTSANRGSTEVDGIEMEFDYSPDSRLAINSGFSVIDVSSSNEDFKASFPEFTAFASLLYRFGHIHELSATYHYLDRITWLDSSDEITVAKRLDLRYAYRFSNEFDIEVIGQNLVGEFQDYNAENQHDQVIFVRLSGGF